MAEVQVQVAWVSKSLKAVQDVETKIWYHCADPIFDQSLKGACLKLSLNDDGKIVGGEVLDAAPAPVVKTVKAQISKPAPVATPTSKLATITETAGSTVCGYCGIERHNSHYSVRQVRRECAERQFLRETAIVVDEAAPQSIMQYGLWLAESPRTVFAATVKGHEVIGGPVGSPPPTTPAAAPAPASTPATLKGGRKATKAADKAVVKAGEQMIAESQAGTFDGLLVKHAKNTPGLFQFLTTTMPNAKAHGDWVVAVTQDVIAKILKAEMNDRVRVTLVDSGERNPIVTDFEILSTIAADSGIVKGIERSGKQQAPASKGVKADKVVKAGRTARKAASVAVAAADRAEAAAATTATLAGKVKNTNTPAKAKRAATNAAKAQKSAPAANCSGASMHRVTCKGTC